MKVDAQVDPNDGMVHKALGELGAADLDDDPAYADADAEEDLTAATVDEILARKAAPAAVAKSDDPNAHRYLAGPASRCLWCSRSEAVHNVHKGLARPHNRASRYQPALGRQ